MVDTAAAGGSPAGGSAAADAAAAEILARLREGGGRITTARRLVVGALLETSGHQTAEQLAARVQDQAPDVHLSTVYRNLDELERLDIISHVHLGHGPAVYHLATENHGHLVCTACGQVTEAPEAAFTGLVRTLLEEFGFEVDAHHFAVQGTCAHCAPGAPSAAAP